MIEGTLSRNKDNVKSKSLSDILVRVDRVKKNWDEASNWLLGTRPWICLSVIVSSILFHLKDTTGDYTYYSLPVLIHVLMSWSVYPNHSQPAYRMAILVNHELEQQLLFFGLVLAF